MNFLYNFFKWTRKTTVVILSFISLALVAGMVVGAHYLKDGEIVQSFIESINEIIKNIKDAGQGSNIEVPEFLITVRDLLTTSNQMIMDIGNGVYIGGIIFLIVFGLILILSFITWLVYIAKNNKTKINK